MKFEIEYRIKNLKEAIRILVEMDSGNDEYEYGYEIGKIEAHESELRFLEGLLKTIA